MSSIKNFNDWVSMNENENRTDLNEVKAKSASTASSNVLIPHLSLANLS